jgi:hypothetical protein
LALVARLYLGLRLNLLFVLVLVVAAHAVVVALVVAGFVDEAIICQCRGV